eukprot:CAMPEP_0195128728 /NCGR_PEP_ID=MMETSP0448-20130528/139804_1 /TAXON_ID=66468 /ORGANISM="Heterocapsa triquestra, Strain CCMP 448" /LENGTH=99 /DNA_ID=CAMNT_0040166543 /DNA_START=99 /DNA_END=395 /DNA_ORIENTATION=+
MSTSISVGGEDSKEMLPGSEFSLCLLASRSELPSGLVLALGAATGCAPAFEGLSATANSIASPSALCASSCGVGSSRSAASLAAAPLSSARVLPVAAVD